MNRIILTVPEMIRYLSQWNDFKLSNFQGHNILHKQIPGCGFTELALTSPENVVLCSPRKMLMENKKDQHENDVYLVVNQYEPDSDIDEDVSKPESPSSIEMKEKLFLEKLQAQTDNINNLYSRLFQEIGEYITKRSLENKPIKIIVTYDSTYLVKQILTQMGIIDSFWFVVDEFQSILEDSRFKSSTEVEFLYILQGIKNVLYVSATPMLTRYLIRIPELASLPYYELDWITKDSSRVKKPNLKVRVVSSPAAKMCEIIQSYLDGKFEKAIVDRGGWFEEVESKEAIFYVNCVSVILQVISKMNLTPDQCNILCSNTPSNQLKIQKKLGKKKGFKIGKVPLKGEKCKMFTFCTRTVYLGADFYSTNARSFIFSDANSDCLSVDISMDLAQILGRIRLDENPWKNCAEFYYKTTCDIRKLTQEQLDQLIKKKLEKTGNLLLSYESTPTTNAKNTLAEAYQKIAKMEKYRDNYVAVNKKVNGGLVPVLNNLVLINEQRTFDIQQVDYADRFTVFAAVDREFEFVGLEQDIIKKFFNSYDFLKTYVDKIHMIVDFLLDNPDYKDAIINNLSDSDKIKQQLIVVGPERIKGLGYNITKINKAMGITIFDKSSFMETIYSNFIPGQKYTKKFIKEKLGGIYKSADYKGTPKATDLEEWYEIKRCKITIDGKREEAFEIIKQK